MDRFNKSQAEWNDLGGKNTSEEIYKQPEVWEKVIKLFQSEESLIKRDLDKANVKDMKILLAGAGSSEYVGRSVVYQLRTLGLDADAVGTTDLLTNPKLYLQFEKPTLLVSFARSGDSPESLEAIKVVRKVLKSKLWTANITCNNAGELAVQSQKWKQNFLFILPKATLDKGFAMTSSFTSMILWVLLMFQSSDGINENIKHLIRNINNLQPKHITTLEQLANAGAERIAFIGSNHLQGFAQEASLKSLELSNGSVASSYNSALGFRHGPKAIINSKTIVFVFLSTNSLTRQYDLDLVKEIQQEKICQKIVVFDYKRNNKLASICDHYIYAPSSRQTTDIYAGLFYIYLAQIFAILQSVALRKTPDNPCPTGQINRVVEGVKIHHFK